MGNEFLNNRELIIIFLIIIIVLLKLIIIIEEEYIECDLNLFLYKVWIYWIYILENILSELVVIKISYIDIKYCLGVF